MERMTSESSLLFMESLQGEVSNFTVCILERAPKEIGVDKNGNTPLLSIQQSQLVESNYVAFKFREEREWVMIVCAGSWSEKALVKRFSPVKICYLCKLKVAPEYAKAHVISIGNWLSKIERTFKEEKRDYHFNGKILASILYPCDDMQFKDLINTVNETEFFSDGKRRTIIHYATDDSDIEQAKKLSKFDPRISSGQLHVEKGWLKVMRGSGALVIARPWSEGFDLPIVGYLAMHPIKPREESNARIKHHHLVSFVVDPQFRRQRIATQLLVYSLHRCRGMLLGYCTTDEIVDNKDTAGFHQDVNHSELSFAIRPVSSGNTELMCRYEHAPYDLQQIIYMLHTPNVDR